MVEGGFFVGFALFLFVVGLADDVVAGDVEGGVGGVEGGFEGGAELVIGEDGAEEDAAATEGVSGFEGSFCIPVFVFFFEDVVTEGIEVINGGDIADAEGGYGGTMAGGVACGDVVARGVREGTADEGHAFHITAKAKSNHSIAEYPLAVAVFIGCGSVAVCHGEYAADGLSHDAAVEEVAIEVVAHECGRGKAFALPVTSADGAPGSQ